MLQKNGLVTPQSGRLVNRPGLDHRKASVALGASDKECLALVDAVQPAKIEIATVHQIVGASDPFDKVQKIHIMQFSFGNHDKCGDLAPEVQQRMHLDRRLALLAVASE